MKQFSRKYYIDDDIETNIVSYKKCPELDLPPPTHIILSCNSATKFFGRYFKVETCGYHIQYSTYSLLSSWKVDNILTILSN